MSSIYLQSEIQTCSVSATGAGVGSGFDLSGLIQESLQTEADQK